jgi:DNA replication protein DnaC
MQHVFALVSEEIAHRQQTRLARLTRRAQFPYLKTIDDFNFTYQSSLRLHMLGSALAVDFVTEGRSPILAGKSGRGKRHVAIAIAYRAIQNGFDAFFTTAAALIDDLSAAFRAGELAHALWLRHNRQIVDDRSRRRGQVPCAAQHNLVELHAVLPHLDAHRVRTAGRERDRRGLR